MVHIVIVHHNSKVINYSAWCGSETLSDPIKLYQLAYLEGWESQSGPVCEHVCTVYIAPSLGLGYNDTKKCESRPPTPARFSISYLLFSLFENSIIQKIGGVLSPYELYFTSLLDLMTVSIEINEKCLGKDDRRDYLTATLLF